MQQARVNGDQPMVIALGCHRRLPGERLLDPEQRFLAAVVEGKVFGGDIRRSGQT